jgi:hypothetical protein
VIAGLDLLSEFNERSPHEAPDAISLVSFACFLRGNDREPEVINVRLGQNREHEMLARRRTAILTHRLKVCPVGEGQFAGKLHREFKATKKPERGRRSGFKKVLAARAPSLLGVVLDGVALEVNLGTLGEETLAALAATLVQDVATCLGGHTGTEAVLLLAGAFGRLVGTLHDGLCLN